MNSQYIYIFNLSEDVWPFIKSITDKEEYRQEIEWCINVAERDLISIANENKPIFISPRTINKKYLKYISKLFNIDIIQTMTPKIHTGEICKDIYTDKTIFNKLTKFKNINLVSYSASPQFYKLIDKLKSRGVHVTTSEAPDYKYSKTVNQFGSKSGIRELLPKKYMAPGVICKSSEEVSSIAAKKYIKSKTGVVIKANKGHGGEGIIILKKGDISYKYKVCKKHISNIFNKNNYWKKFPVVIEDFIEVNNKNCGGTPSTEFRIDKNGDIHFLYYCAMRVDNNGFYKGQEIHDSVLTNNIKNKIMDISYYIANKYSKAGYRGYFDIDFMFTKQNRVLVTESNARRTGGTHMYKTALTLIGNDFMKDAYTLSNNDLLLPKYKKITFDRILKLLKPILFNSNLKEGVILASYNSLEMGMIAYVIIGKNRVNALKIESQMEKLLFS